METSPKTKASKRLEEQTHKSLTFIQRKGGGGARMKGKRKLKKIRKEGETLWQSEACNNALSGKLDKIAAA